MSVLSGETIRALIKNEKLKFSPPLDEFQIRDASVDLRMGTTILIPKFYSFGLENQVLDPLEPSMNFEVNELEKGDSFLIPPGLCLILTTMEEVTLPDNVIGTLMPRTSVNRMFLTIDLTGPVDPNYSGRLFVPTINKNPVMAIKIIPGLRIFQIIFQFLDRAVRKGKGSRYTKRDVAGGAKSVAEKEEANFIRKGNLKGLKEKYKI